MSEAVDDTSVLNKNTAPQSRLRFTPDHVLTESLRRFIRNDENPISTTGREGLFLYADRPVVHDEVRHGEIARRGGTESAAVAALGMVLRQRRMQQRQLGKRLQMLPLQEPRKGISLRLDVILDPMTADAVGDFLPLHPDRSIGVHLDVLRDQLVSRPEYLTACRRLYEQLLDDGRRPGIAAIDLVRQGRRS